MTYNRVYSDIQARSAKELVCLQFLDLWLPGQMNRTLCSSIYHRISNKSTLAMFSRDGNGCRVSHFIFGRKRSEQIYAISSFGVLALGLRQRNINNVVFSSEAFKQMISTVNAVPLEQFGANSVNQCYGSTGAVSSKLSLELRNKKRYIRHNYVYVQSFAGRL